MELCGEYFVYVRTTSTRHFVGDLKPFWNVTDIKYLFCAYYYVYVIS